MSNGQFAWRELITTDLSAARGFYESLFGWSHSEQDMGEGFLYTLFHHGNQDKMTGGAMPSPMPGIPSHWLDYTTVDDIDAALAKVVELGGKKITDVMNIPGTGRMATVEDPVGAAFALLQPEGGEDGDEGRPQTGTFCWSQLMTTEPDKAVPFYAALFGWKPTPMGPGGTLFMDGETMRASVMTSDQPHSHWLKYVAVDDTDAAFAKATELGAQVYAPPTTMPGMGRFAVLADPTGATFALWKELSQDPT